MLLIGLLCCSQPTPHRNPTSGEFSVLTYNVHGLPDAISEEVTPREERMALISPLLNDFDVVGLQECFEDHTWQLLTKSANHSTAAHNDSPTSPDVAYGAGLALLIESAQVSIEANGIYEDCFGVLSNASDCLAEKGWQQHNWRLSSGQVIAVFNTHHEAGGDEEDQQARLHQVTQLVSVINALSEEVAVVLTGDFNLNPSRDLDITALNLYTAAGLVSSCSDVGCEQPERIDRIYTRSSTTLKLKATSWALEPLFVDNEGRPLSDHLAISSTVFWREIE